MPNPQLRLDREPRRLHFWMGWLGVCLKSRPTGAAERIRFHIARAQLDAALQVVTRARHGR